MPKTGLRTLLVVLTFAASDLRAAGGIVVIGNTNVTSLDATTLERIYMGKVIEVNGIPVKAVNATSGAVRSRFLQIFVKKDEDGYKGYWTVRRFNGLGAPPPEVTVPAEMINFVRSTPGAIGYIDEADLPPGVNVLLK